MRRIGLAVLLAAGSIAGAAALGIGDAAQRLGAQIVVPTRALAQGNQVASGQQVYQQACASCHGDFGEGFEDAPPLIGAGTQIADYRTAARLYNFISSEMPADEPGSLSSQQYYDVLAYLLDQNGLNPSGEPVNSSTAANIQLQ
jgi:mono/diheme cytochrome c family protein